MAMGTVKIEVLETVGGTNYVLDGTALDTTISGGVKLVQYTPKPGVRSAKFRITEDGGGTVVINQLICGTK